MILRDKSKYIIVEVVLKNGLYNTTKDRNYGKACKE